ncbi:hypothetical protein G7092_06625 [Mucilaginibacter sp. HC2]|uniref:Cthe_2314 family HEPN domain-containing protein n=1 Tax=Mucilaginibacter inviolabilis TaxID=2714892 RepID=UPI0014091ED1|nr:Cthe_2314 family HEPN domain-containing protein [Mucilaginibacter inviolabilis]NHA03458.1 hypothetical protein [Mucilaginibacter inviolabilis]
MKDDIDDSIEWNSQSLFSTPLGQEVQKVTTAMLLNKHEKTSEYALYMKSVNDVLYDLSQSFWDIDMTIKLIEFAHPKVKSFKMTRVDRGDYIKFMWENYFFRLPKLKDITLNLVNVVYRMGHTQSPGLEKRVRKNSDVQAQKLYLYLDYFDDAFQKIKPLRDRIAHRGDLEDSTLAMLSTYQLSPYDKEVYETQLKGLVSYNWIFEKNQGILKQAVLILLMHLKDDFDRISASLSQTP